MLNVAVLREVLKNSTETELYFGNKKEAIKGLLQRNDVTEHGVAIAFGIKCQEKCNAGWLVVNNLGKILRILHVDEGIDTSCVVQSLGDLEEKIEKSHR